MVRRRRGRSKHEGAHAVGVLVWSFTNNENACMQTQDTVVASRHLMHASPFLARCGSSAEQKKGGCSAWPPHVNKHEMLGQG